jgi:hypothetical protein
VHSLKDRPDGTTSIIAELLIIGFFNIIWILLFSVRLSLVDIDSLKHLAASVQSTPALMVIAALSYQLGVVMNGISHKLTKRFGQSQYRSQISRDVPYESIKMKVRQDGSDEMNRTLNVHLSVVRLTRAGIINFFLISIAMFSFGGKIALAGIVILFIRCCVLSDGEERIEVITEEWPMRIKKYQDSLSTIHSLKSREYSQAPLA